MNVNQIRLHLARQPFEPFVISVADGASFKVDHPELLQFSDTARTVHFTSREGRRVVINLMLVTRLETLELANPKPESE